MKSIPAIPRSLPDEKPAIRPAARLQSFTRAAGELHLTQAAVSRQIRLLEENLGTPLFHRAHRAVSLTPMGKSFQSTVALALAHIANAAVEHRGTTPKTHLNLVADQSIAWLWLMPRLAGFREAHPEINVHLVASDNKSDCLASEIDIAIAFGPDDWPGFLSEELFGEEIFPVCSPTYLQAQKIESSEDLLRCTLLELEDDTWGWVNWRMWLTSQGIHSPVETRSIQINNYPMVLQSARNGMGIALGWLVPVTALPAVPRYLSGDGPRVPSELNSYLSLRQTPIQQGVNLASFAIGQVVVASRHDNPPY